MNDNLERATEPEKAAARESVEDAAVRIVIGCERRLGRDARDVRKRRKVADIESGDRHIEVKAFAGPFKPRLGSLLFTPPEVLHARENDAYYVYLVENVRDKSNVEIRVLHGEHLRKVMTDPGIAIQRYSVPLRRGDYDNMPRLEQGDRNRRQP